MTAGTGAADKHGAHDGQGPPTAGTIRVVSLDLDGTLVHPAVFHAAADALGFGHRLHDTLQAYEAGRLSLEEAFWADLRHFEGLEAQAVQEALAGSACWEPELEAGIRRLHEAGMHVLVTTDQPRWAAETALRWGVDGLVCSPGPTPEGRISTEFEPLFQKWPNLQAWLAAEGLPPAAVVHVGNGRNDVPVFEQVGASVAVHTEDPVVVGAATGHVPHPQTFHETVDAVLGLGARRSRSSRQMDTPEQ